MNQQLKHPIFVSNDEHKGSVSKEVFRMGFERGIGTIYHGK